MGSNTNQCLLSASVAAGTEHAFKLQNGALYAEKECWNLHPPDQVPPPGRPYPAEPGRPVTDPGSHYPSGTDQDSVLSPYPCRYTLTYEKIAGAAYGSGHR